MDDAVTVGRAAFEKGREDGWTHACFIDAYGGDINEAPTVPPGVSGFETFYLAGWDEGLSNYGNGLYANGDPIE